MIRRLLVGLLLLGATTAHAQPTLVGQVTTTTCSGTSSCGATSGVTAQASDLGVALLATRSSGTVASSVSGGGGTWVCPPGASLVDVGVRAASICYNLALSAGSAQPTVTMSGTEGGAIFYSFSVYRCASGTWQLDGVNEAIDSSSPYSGGSVTTLGPSALVNVSAQPGSWTDETPAANWTQLTSAGSREFWSYRLAASGVTDDGAWTSPSSGDVTQAVAGFSCAGGGGGATPKPGLILGVGRP